MQIVGAPITFMAAASLLSADAFAPTYRMMSSRSTLGGGGGALPIMASDKPLTELCEITKEACEAVAPMLNGEIRFAPGLHPVPDEYNIRRVLQYLFCCCSVICSPNRLLSLHAELYSQIKIGTGTSDTAAFKSDATFFTIADGIVQHMFIEYLFAGDKFGNIVGEEDDSVVNILEVRHILILFVSLTQHHDIHTYIL